MSSFTIRHARRDPSRDRHLATRKDFSTEIAKAAEVERTFRDILRELSGLRVKVLSW
jgi:hypothetical protein